MDFLAAHWLDILTTILGLAYILFEYKASRWMWLVGFLMEALGIVLYYQKGLYADCGMETYYLIMTFYGYWSWVRPEKGVQGSRVQGSKVQGSRVQGSRDQGSRVQGSKVQGSEFKAQDTVLNAGPSTHNSERPIRHFPKKLILPWLLVIAAVWGTIYWILVTFTDSSVPLADSFTTALSIVGVWALAHKYLEQWFVWIVVDVITCGLYFYKDIPFKASLYGLYVIIAIAGYFNWRKKMKVDYNKEEIKGKNEPIFRNNS